MTIKELIVELEKHDQGLEVLVDRYSDFDRASNVDEINGRDHGGWVARHFYPLADGSLPRSTRFLVIN